jgi:hypothetical protein
VDRSTPGLRKLSTRCVTLHLLDQTGERSRVVIQDIAAIAAATVAGLSALSAAFWWVYRRGKASGRTEVTLQAMDQALARTSAAVEELADRMARVELERNRRGILRRLKA